MTDNRAFSATVSAWTAASQARLNAVFRDAAQTVANEVRRPKSAGGAMPVDTGNLRRSLLASTSSLPSVRVGDQAFPDNDDQITLTIAGAQLGDKIYMGFQAAYARRMEYGFVGADSLGRYYNQQGNGFVRLTAQRWTEIVHASAQKMRSRTEARGAFSGKTS